MSLPTIPIDSIHPHPDNVRRDLGDLSELAVSIRAQGLLQPLVVMQTAKGWTVIDGHRRLAAAKLAGARALPCIATKQSDTDAQLSTMLAAALHKGLEPMEQARAFQRLRARGLSVADIARRTGYSTATVSARLVLVGLPDEVQDMVAEKQITVSEATELAREVRRNGSGTAQPAVKKSVWFGPSHPLAARVVGGCDHVETRRSVAGACGQCWEAAIRTDERQRAQSQGARA